MSAALRCNVGDLVVVVRARILHQNKGRFGTIIGRGNLGLDWVVSPQRTFVGYMKPSNKLVDDSSACEFLDDSLMPIRPQSDDAVDEMVKLVGIAPMTAAEVLAWSEVSHG